MFKEENISRRSNLEENDSLSAYLDCCAQQNPNAFKVFYDFIEEVKPIRILEIGTSLGGFTTFLKRTCVELGLDTDLRSYDIYERQGYDQIRSEGVDLRIENIFSDDYTSVHEEVGQYVNSPGKTIVLCDGGYKIGEFNILSKYLKVGDFILAHDYAPTTEYYLQNVHKQLWNWHEIEDINIENAVKENDLQSYKPEIFQSAVWVCKIKN
jgi:cephalosporin hydroxylase